MELPAQIYQDLKDALPALEEALKTGVSYGGDLAHRFIMYDIAQNVFYVLMPAILFSISLYFSIKFAVKAYSANHESDLLDFLTGTSIILTASIGAWLLMAFLTSAPAILKDIYIPEVRIMEVVGDLLQSNQ